VTSGLKKLSLDAEDATELLEYFALLDEALEDEMLEDETLEELRTLDDKETTFSVSSDTQRTEAKRLYEKPECIIISLPDSPRKTR
jgi:hypothetical protein